MPKTKTTKKPRKSFPKDKAGQFTFRAMVAVDSDGKHAVHLIDNPHDTLDNAIEDTFGDTSGKIVDFHLVEQTVKFPAAPKAKKSKPKSKKVATRKRDAKSDDGDES